VGRNVLHSVALSVSLLTNDFEFDNLNFGVPSCPMNDCLSLIDITVGQWSLPMLLFSTPQIDLAAKRFDTIEMRTRAIVVLICRLFGVNYCRIIRV